MPQIYLDTHTHTGKKIQIFASAKLLASFGCMQPMNKTHI